MGIDELENRAKSLYNKIIENIDIDSEGCKLEIVDSYSEVGGGSLPLEKIPTKCIKISFEDKDIIALERALREYEIPIITRVYKESLFIDLRTIRDEELNIVADGLSFGFNRLKGCIR